MSEVGSKSEMLSARLKTSSMHSDMACSGATRAKNAGQSFVCHHLVSEAVWINARRHQDAAARIVPMTAVKTGIDGDD